MSTGVIAVCCTEVHKEPSKPLVNRLTEAAEEKGLRLVVFQVFSDFYYKTDSEAGARSVFDIFNPDMFDAMVLLPMGFKDETVTNRIVQRCKDGGLPIISVMTPTDGASAVLTDPGSSFGQIVEHVITKHGCRRIKLVAGMRDNEFSQARIDACAEVMAAHGLELTPENIMYGEFWEEPTYKVMDEFFATGEALPDAFICCNDSMAMAVCLKLGEHGYSVPRDVIVTGFDGIEMEKYHVPRLCNAVCDEAGIARAVIETAEMYGKDRNAPPVTRVVNYIPIFSESCGCVTDLSADRNIKLTDFIRNYAEYRIMEEHMNDMECSINSNPSSENVCAMMHKYGFGQSALCISAAFKKYFDGVDKEPKKTVYPCDMHIFESSFYNGAQPEGTMFPSQQLLPNFDMAFDGHNTIFVFPVHFQRTSIGYFVTAHSKGEHHNERLYTYLMTINRCMETMRLHEHLSMLNKRLSFLFEHDQLTGIYNRYGFYQYIEDRLKVNSTKFAFILSIDLNDMKDINDTHGHAAGDEALLLTANAMTAAAGDDKDIICARFGGDEFMTAKILDAEGDTVDTAKQQGERYRKSFEQLIAEYNATRGNPFTVKVSIGLVHGAVLNSRDLNALMEIADNLMYDDKSRKKKPRNSPRYTPT